MLIVLSGLPGVGKTTIAAALARAVGGVHLRIDSIERVLADAGWAVEGHGYLVAHALAADNLRVGRIVIADCVNPWPLTRRAWSTVAVNAGVPALDVEVVCSDVDVHRERVERRRRQEPGERYPAWRDVLQRDCRSWDGERLIIDTARLSVEQSVRQIVGRMALAEPGSIRERSR